MLKEYSEWMYSSVMTNEYGDRIHGYHKLMNCLNSIPFTYLLPMDENRESDGINLRYIFGGEKGYPQSQVASELDVYPCSVLEMMIALCRRLESDIMGCDPEHGNRTSIWFQNMLECLGVEYMDDEHFDEDVVIDILNTCLGRQYMPNGNGGNFFIIHNVQADLRKVEIWYQAMWWLNEYIGDDI